MLALYLLLVRSEDIGGTLSAPPFTTGAVFLFLTGAITYLYRARDKDHDDEIRRLERELDRRQNVIDKLRREAREREQRDR